MKSRLRPIGALLCATVIAVVATGAVGVQPAAAVVGGTPSMVEDYPYFASFRGQCGYYLEDIFVAEDFRRNGLGEAMVKIVAKLARQRGYERIDFQVLEWNTPAVKFYEKLGAIRDDSERHFKFIDHSFSSLVADEPV